MSAALNLEAAMLGVWLGVHSVRTRYRAGAGAGGRRSFLV